MTRSPKHFDATNRFGSEWFTDFKVGDLVIVKHHKSTRKAKLLKKKPSMRGVWWIEKHHPDGTKTKGLYNEINGMTHTT